MKAVGIFCMNWNSLPQKQTKEEPHFPFSIQVFINVLAFAAFGLFFTFLF